jgi:hypothetical protein
MVNRVAYGKLPNKEEFVRLYVIYSQRQLGEFYGCNKIRIRKWIKHFNLPLRKRGGGNNRKYSYDDNKIKDLVAQGLTNEDISEKLGIPKRSIVARRFKLKIQTEYKTTDFNRYARKARYLTETTYAKYKDVLNPGNLPRTLCGVDGGYQLDHKVSIQECFNRGVSLEECSSLDNLQMIPWEVNLDKRKFSRRCNNDD